MNVSQERLCDSKAVSRESGIKNESIYSVNISNINIIMEKKEWRSNAEDVRESG